MVPTIIKAIVLIAIVAALAGVGYYFISRSTSNTAAAPINTPRQSQNGQEVVNLTQLSNSGELGTAVLEEKGGYVIVTLNVTGGKDGIAQPAHIHSDTCPGLGPVKYPLKNVVNGSSVTTLNVSLAQLKQELPLSINVHESTDNFKSYVACGEISLP